MTHENSSSLHEPTFSHQRPIILIAEDDRAIRNNMAQLLENEGYQVIETANGEECLEAYQQTPPNLVLLDAMMPKMNGFECCKQLMQLPGSALTPILMITGLDDEASINWAFDSGASDFITKPIRWPVLRKRVRVHLEKSQLNKELEKANQKLIQLASIDDLTQLTNRRVFSEQLQAQWQRRETEQTSLSLILGDIDYFKLYNDTYGHLQGDQCLIKVASTIKQCLKHPTDLAARYGGEEFVVLLPKTSLESALQIAEEIRMSVKDLAIPHQYSALPNPITISLGVACAAPSNPLIDPNILLQCADKALYQAKAEGRDQVSVDLSLG